MSQAARERSEHILTQVYENGRVTVKELAERFGVSEATVRRDLKSLSEAGRIEMVYGGASLARADDYSFHSKGMRNIEAKRVVGRLAAELVGDHEQVFVDSGTTCFQMAHFLKGRRGLSIIANSARLALELDTPGLHVILLGGEYRPDRMDTAGPMATASLEGLRGYVAFIGADGLSMDFGPAANDIESAHINGLAVRNARHAVLLVDHTKFLSPSLCKIVDFDAIAKIVTDRRPAADWMEYFDSLGIDVICPAEEPSPENQPDAP